MKQQSIVHSGPAPSSATRARLSPSARNLVFCIDKKSAIGVSERKGAEEEGEKPLQLEADLAQVNRVSRLGKLASVLSHELKQPIPAAITNANICLRRLPREEPDIEAAREAAARIVRDGNHAADIINRLRSLYKKGALVARELVNVNDVLREMLALLRNEAGKYSITLKTELAPELGTVRADRVQLQQLFMNLTLNAIEAMKETGGELAVKAELSQGGRLVISVSETGVGLSAERADQIFNTFFNTKLQGRGVALAISRSIVEAYGGDL